MHFINVINDIYDTGAIWHWQAQTSQYGCQKKRISSISVKVCFMAQNWSVVVPGFSFVFEISYMGTCNQRVQFSNVFSLDSA